MQTGANLPENSSNEKLFELLYEELKRIARIQMKGENPGHSLQPTALINEAYLRFMAGKNAPLWKDEKHFLCVAASVMRRILIDSARAKATQKRGGDQIQVDLDVQELLPQQPEQKSDILSVHEALIRLQSQAPEQARLIELRFFGGLTIDEAADTMEISRSTAKNYWNFGKAWLFRELNQ